MGHGVRFALGHGARFGLRHRARFDVAQGHHRGRRMGSPNRPCRTSCLSSMETIALQCLVSEKNALSCTRFRRQTDRQTNIWIASLRKAPLLRAVA